MPKKSNIKWTKNQQNLLTNAVRQFNAALTRAAKRYPLIEKFLPARANVKDLKQKIKTGENLKTTLNSLNRIKKKDAFELLQNKAGKIITKYERRQIGIELGVINRAKKRELKRLNPSTEKGTMGSVEANNLKPKKFDFENMSNENWDKFVESVHKQSSFGYYDDKMENYRKNLYTAIREQLPMIADYFISRLEKISTDVLYDSFYESPFAQLGFVYSQNEANYIMERMIREFEEYEEMLNAPSS